jgi:predicted DNA binding protein
MSAMVAALATRLGIGHSAAQRVLNQLEALGREGIDSASPAFAAIARDLGVSPAQLTGALRAAKQSLAGM